MNHQLARLSNVSLSILALAALGACGGGGSDPAPAAPTVQTQAVTIEFAATAGATVLSNPCSATLAAQGSTGVGAKVTDLRFYVANVHMIDANDKEVPVTLDANSFQLSNGTDSVALIDMEDGTCTNNATGTAATNIKVTGTVAKGSYTGVAMTLGVPESMNHTDFAAAAAPINVQAMAWSWQSGRKHLKIELSPEAGAAGSGVYTGGIKSYASAAAATAAPAVFTAQNSYYYHLGNTGCIVSLANANGYVCTGNNQMGFHLHAFDPATQRISVDLTQLFAGNDVTKDVGGPIGCMSGTDAECTSMFQTLLGAQHGSTVFRAITK